MTDEMNRLIITNEDGQEIECEILFTFDSQEYEKNYVVFSPIGEEYVDEDGYPELHAASYTPNNEDGEGILSAIEDDAEWDMIEDIIVSFLEHEEEDDGDLIS